MGFTGNLAHPAEEEFASLEVHGRAGHRLAWENEREAILSDLMLFLDQDTRQRQGGWSPVAFEQSFGTRDPESWPGPEVRLADGRVGRLRGRIDRLDLGPSPDRPSRAMVLDYKTGRPYDDPKELERDPVVAGRLVQLAAYSLAVRARYPGLRAGGLLVRHLTGRLRAAGHRRGRLGAPC